MILDYVIFSLVLLFGFLEVRAIGREQDRQSRNSARHAGAFIAHLDDPQTSAR